MQTTTRSSTHSDGRLSRLCKAVLDHVGIYGLTVLPAVQTLKPCRRLTGRDLRRLLTSLTDEGRLKVIPLFAGQRGYVLDNENSDSFADRLSGPQKPLSEETKLRRYAMLSLCCLGSVSRQRLSRDDVVEHIGLKSRQGVADSYYRDDDRIGFLRVDMTGHGRWDRIIARCKTDAWHHAQHPQWKPLVEDQKLEMTLATALPQKADRLCRAINELAIPPPVPVRVVAIPDLLYFIAPPRDC